VPRLRSVLHVLYLIFNEGYLTSGGPELARGELSGEAILERMTDNPMVTLNRAIATAMVDGPAAGLAVLDTLDEPLAGHHRLHATRAHLLEMAGDPAAAIVEYRTAADRTKSLPEQHYLTTQAARLGDSR
jgi:predicted RNA polymerase sigma factor